MDNALKVQSEKIIEDICRENNLERHQVADWLKRQNTEALEAKLQSKYQFSPQICAFVMFELVNAVVEDAKKKTNSFINGNLITGGVASGKTTILAYEIKNFVRWNPDWILLAAGSEELFGKLPSEIRENTEHKFISVNFLALSEIQPAAEKFMTMLTEAIAEEKTLLIAVDEPAHFFASEKLRSRFAMIIKRANLHQNRQIFLLMTYQQISVCEALFGAEFAKNFGIYTVLQNSRTDEFFRSFGLDSRKIKRGEGHIFQKNAESGKLEFPSIYSESNPILRFTPGLVDSIVYAPPPEQPDIFTILAGLFRKFKEFSAQYKISH